MLASSSKLVSELKLKAPNQSAQLLSSHNDSLEAISVKCLVVVAWKEAFSIIRFNCCSRGVRQSLIFQTEHYVIMLAGCS